jgi:hypothetical protein
MEEEFRGVIWTKHAIRRLYERRIAQSDAWYTLRRPDKTLKGKKAGSFVFCKDYGKQRIKVVARQNEKKEWVVLSCWSKIIGTGKPIFFQKESLVEKLIKKLLPKK